MNLKAGTKIRVRDGYGRIVVEQAEVTRYVKGAAIVFVRECTSDGQGLLYGLPISAVEEIGTAKLSISEVVGALRTCFGLSDKNETR